jgi:cobalt-zinc-cadmium efflux system membrane fusion protein
MKKGWLFLSLVWVSCSKVQQETKKEFCIDESKVAFTEAKLEMLREGIHLTGSIEPNPEKVIQYTPLWSGTVLKTYFGLGDKVRKGQLLAEVQSTDISALSSTLSGLESRIRAGLSRVQTLSTLLRDGMVSKQEYEDAVADVEVLRAEKARVERDTQLYRGHNASGTLKVYAPSNGVITEKNMHEGEQVTAGGPSLFTMADFEDLWLLVNVYASHVDKIKEGMEVDISSLSYPGDNFKGKINRISPAFDEEARVLKARANFHNRENKLKPGMVVDVMAWQHFSKEAICIPVSSLVFSDNQYYVVVYQGPCQVEVRKVEVLAKDREKAFLAEGLSAGEKIISKNQLLVFEAL